MRMIERVARVVGAFAIAMTMAMPCQVALADGDLEPGRTEGAIDEGLAGPEPDDESVGGTEPSVGDADGEGREDGLPAPDSPEQDTQEDPSSSGPVEETGGSQNSTDGLLPEPPPEEASRDAAALEAQGGGEPPIADGAYSIACPLDPSCVIDIASASRSDGAPAKIWTENGQENQAFEFERQSDGSYVIRALHSSKVLAVSGFSASQGASVIQWEDNGTKNMRWLVHEAQGGAFRLESADTGMLLDFASNTCYPGADAVVWGSTGSQKQMFSLVPYDPGEEEPSSDLRPRTIPDGVYSLDSAQDPSRSLAILGAGTSNGVEALAQTGNSSLSQKFHITFQPVEGDLGWYAIRALCSGKVLAVAGLDAGKGASVLQWSDNGTKNMRWFIEGSDESGYNVVSADTGLLLDFACSYITAGAEAVVWESTGSAKQRLLLQQKKVLEDGYYTVAPSSDPSLLVNVNGDASHDGVNTILELATGSLAQKFRVSSNGDGTYQFKACHSGKVLDVSSEGKIVQVEQSSSPSQRWMVAPDSYGGFAIGTVCEDGRVVCFWTGGNVWQSASIWAQEYPPSNSDQSFLLREANIVEDGLYVINPAESQALSLSMSSGSLSSGQDIQLSSSSTSPRQKFYVRNVGAGAVQIASELSDKVLCVAYGSSRGAPVVQWDNNGTDNMKWELVPTYQGSVYVRNVASGMNLDYAANSAVAGAEVVVWDPHGGSKQMFSFDPTTPPPFKVYIDAGHGWNSSQYGEYDPGATSLFREADLTNELASMVADACDDFGIPAVTNAYATSETGVPYFKRQADARALDCTTLVSIHFNSGGGTGVESYIHTYNAAQGSPALQSIMHRYLVAGTGLLDRGMGEMELAVCGGKLPAVLLEVGFIDNVFDMNSFQVRKSQVANFLAAGIREASRNSVCNGYN